MNNQFFDSQTLSYIEISDTGNQTLWPEVAAYMGIALIAAAVTLFVMAYRDGKRGR